MRPWLSGSLLAFLATGVYLVLANDYYLGVGNFGNAWLLLMLVKHVLVIAMIVLATLLMTALKTSPALADQGDSADIQPLGRARLMVHALSILGVLVLLLTAVAEIQ